eukprot:363291-Chlamydomonas_euryale.AAC.7
MSGSCGRGCPRTPYSPQAPGTTGRGRPHACSASVGSSHTRHTQLTQASPWRASHTLRLGALSTAWKQGRGAGVATGRVSGWQVVRNVDDAMCVGGGGAARTVSCPVAAVARNLPGSIYLACALSALMPILPCGS